MSIDNLRFKGLSKTLLEAVIREIENNLTDEIKYIKTENERLHKEVCRLVQIVKMYNKNID